MMIKQKISLLFDDEKGNLKAISLSSSLFRG